MLEHFELLDTEINCTMSPWKESPVNCFTASISWHILFFSALVLQAVFYGVSFLADVLRLIKKLRCAKCVISSRDLLFSVLAFPVSTFVSISFWTLYSYNRELVYPKSLDGVIPLWLNHAMHTAILPFAVLEILALPHCYPAKKKGLIFLGLVSFLYISWVLRIYSVTGEWVYPLFALFNPAGLAAFFAVSLAIIISFYSFGEFLNRMIWGQSEFCFSLLSI
uniref:Androgen dependent TFPI regulating protein n=1 Tax=Strigops habroptila TaxID=2489341 RepID=A0A672U6R7_STRHB